MAIQRILSLSVLAAALAACGVPRTKWRELPTGPMPFQDVWVAVEEAARSDGYVEDEAESDRGLGRFTTRWFQRGGLGFGRNSRTRLHAEIEPRREAAGWLVRYWAERQHVADMAKGISPAEEDWSRDGQDAALEERFGMKLRLRFGLR